jgi:predicted RNase H-like nuclease (RuvC/YqgF family)
VQTTKFIEENKATFQKLKSETDAVKKKIANLDQTVLNIKAKLREIDYVKAAHDYLANKAISKEQMLEKIYA